MNGACVTIYKMLCNCDNFSCVYGKCQIRELGGNQQTEVKWYILNAASFPILNQDTGEGKIDAIKGIGK